MGASVKLQLLIGSLVPLPASQELTDALVSAEVRANTREPSGFQLTFSAGKGSSIVDTELPLGGLDPKTRVILVALVDNWPHVLIDGIVTRQDFSPGAGAGEAKLTLSGTDLSVLMGLRQQWQAFPAMPANLRVMAICAKYAMYGIIPAAVPPISLDIPVPIERIPVCATTDLDYIQQLAAEVGYTFFVEAGPAPGANIAYWGPEVRAGMIQPALSVNSDSSSNVESLEFSYDGEARTQLTITIIEPNSKIGIPIPIPEVSVFKPPLAARPALTMREEQLERTGHLNPIAAAMLGLARGALTGSAVTGSGTLDVARYGHVLKSRQLVGVRGASLAFDGNYFVTSVTSTLARGEFKQSFSLAREGLVPFGDRVLA